MDPRLNAHTAEVKPINEVPHSIEVSFGGGADRQSGGTDRRSSGTDRRTGGTDHRTGGTDRRIAGTDRRSGGGERIRIVAPLMPPRPNAAQMPTAPTALTPPSRSSLPGPYLAVVGRSSTSIAALQPLSPRPTLLYPPAQTPRNLSPCRRCPPRSLPPPIHRPPRQWNNRLQPPRPHQQASSNGRPQPRRLQHRLRRRNP